MNSSKYPPNVKKKPSKEIKKCIYQSPELLCPQEPNRKGSGEKIQGDDNARFPWPSWSLNFVDCEDLNDHDAGTIWLLEDISDVIDHSLEGGLSSYPWHRSWCPGTEDCKVSSLSVLMLSERCDTYLWYVGSWRWSTDSMMLGILCSVLF